MEKPVSLILIILLLLASASATYLVEHAEANPVPYPLIRMPEEYIYANITVSDGNAFARVNTTYPFTENDFSTVSMSYPLPVNATDVDVRVDGNETYWWYTDQTYETVYGNIPVINWTISPAPDKFVVNVDYNHEVPKIGQNYTYFYPMGTWKSLEGIYNKLITAYVTVDVNNVNVSDNETLDINAYQIRINSTTDEWIWKPLKYSVSRTDGKFRISATVESYLFSPILDDLVIAFKKREKRTVRVPDDHPTVQSAIDAANYEDTVLVTSGTYHEHLSVWKSIYVVSEGEVIIDANNSESAVEITADYVHFCGFTIQNSGTTELPVFASCGLIIASNGCNITHNVVRNNHAGIFLYATNGNVLTDNTMIGNKYNFFFYNFGVGGYTVERYLNDIDTSNTVDGKPIYYWVGQHDKKVPEDAGYVAVIASTNITVKDVVLSNNSEGILFWNTNDSIIQDVKVINNYMGIYLYYSYNNSIYHNNFIGNDHANAYCLWSSNGWQRYEEGNYWSDYLGTDSNKDGIGDTPYTISIDNLDHYPLMKPYGGPHDIGITRLAAQKTVIGLNQSLGISIDILNYGIADETTNVTFYIDSSDLWLVPCLEIMGDIGVVSNVTLVARNSTTISIEWNTRGLDYGIDLYGVYVIGVHASPVTNETEMSDNRKSDLQIIITIPADLNGNRVVDICDAIMLANHFNSHQSDPHWDPNADVDGDGSIDAVDASVLVDNFGRQLDIVPCPPI